MGLEKQLAGFNEQLLDGEVGFKALFKSSPDPTWIINEKNLFVLCNLAAATVLGYDSVEALQAVHPSELSPEFQPDGQSSREKADAMMAAAHREGVYRFEWEHRRRNGECFPVEVTLSVLNAGDKPFLYCIWRDITERKQYEQALRSSEQRLEYLIKSTPAVIYSSKASGDYAATFISDNVRQQLGYEPCEFTDDPNFWQECIHPADREGVLSELPDLSEQGGYAHEYRFRNKAGDYRWMRDEMRLQRNEQGEPQEILGYWIDITERKQAEEAMQLQSEIAQNIAEGINLVRAEDGVFVYVNEKFEQMYGYAPGEMVGKHVSTLNAPNTRSPQKVAEEVTQGLRSNGYWSGELKNVRKDGSIFWSHSAVSVFEHSQYGQVFLGVQRDISEQKEMEQKLQQLNKELELRSLQDGLTEIANRRMFDVVLGREWSRGMRERRPLSLIMIDIDFFKQYNDYYGHLQGDICLKEIAQRLSQMTKRTLDLCARYGGEEFVLLLPNTDIEQAARLAEECREKVIQLAIAHESSEICDVVTISAGVCTVVPSTTVSSSSLVAAADAALYQAKRGGRNRVELDNSV